jgi:hypothetical protein
MKVKLISSGYEISATIRSRVLSAQSVKLLEIFNAIPLSFLVLGDALGVSGTPGEITGRKS